MSVHELLEPFPHVLDARWRTRLRGAATRWFAKHQRDLPWRTNRTLYRVWVSEIMLQQTQVATVVPYFKRFVKKFPDIQRLADASQQAVLRSWEGLGYYRRARQLHAAARVIVDKHAGRFPQSFDEVLALPGIGRYTAGAILSIGADQPLPILEGNTKRLFARLLALRRDISESQSNKLLWQFAETILPRKKPGDFNQAMMEIGNQICKPAQPDCESCPLALLCPTNELGLQDRIPRNDSRMKYESVIEAAVIVRRRNKILLRQCRAGERWEGLWDFPRFSLNEAAAGSGAGKTKVIARRLVEMTGLQITVGPLLKKMRHAVTRFKIELECYESRDVSGRLAGNGSRLKWYSADELGDLPLSVTGRKIADDLLMEKS